MDFLNKIITTVTNRLIILNTILSFFLFNVPPTTEIYTLSLHDALPIYSRVSLAGKTVMPMLIDTHVHLSPTREALTRDLQRRAYFGVSAALSLGMDKYEVLDLRGQ